MVFKEKTSSIIKGRDFTRSNSHAPKLSAQKSADHCKGALCRLLISIPFIPTVYMDINTRFMSIFPKGYERDVSGNALVRLMKRRLILRIDKKL